MVKKFIKGLLGKKEEKPVGKEEKGIEEVPDELPPLAEDILQKEGEKPVNEEKGAEEVADELPPLAEDILQKEGEKPAEKEEPTKEEGEDDLLKEFKKYKEEYYKENEEKSEKKEEVVEKKEELEKEGKTKTIEKEIIKKPIFEPAPEKEEEKGFFSDLLSITKRQGINESILKQDLSKKMKEYWYFHPLERGEFKNKEKLEHDLFDKLSQLKRLEERWIAQKRFIEEDKRILLEKEREIETKTEELQKILNQLRFYEDVPNDKYFWLSNGMVAKNLHELMNLLKVIDDKTFYCHVNDKKNDFSYWIENAIGNKELTKKVGFAKTREDIIKILEDFL